MSGYRNFTDVRVVGDAIRRLKPSVIIHGDCRGVDHIAGEVGKEIGCEVILVPADWSMGPKAGPVRNRRMVRDYRPDHILMFMSVHSKGTRNMLDLAERYGIPHTIVNVDGDETE